MTCIMIEWSQHLYPIHCKLEHHLFGAEWGEIDQKHPEMDWN